MPPATLFTDADNTLWDTDAVFAAAQLALLAEVEEEAGRRHAGADRLAFVRTIDQALAAGHHSCLRYPPRLLTLAVAAALTGLPPAQAARRALKGGIRDGALSGTGAGAAEGSFLTAIRALPALRPGVREGLERLRSGGCRIFVVTEELRRKVAGIAAARPRRLSRPDHRIAEAPRSLSPRAAPRRHARARADGRRPARPRHRPGQGRRPRTIWFPGGFRPGWEPEVEAVRPDHVVAGFEEVVGIVLGPDEQKPRA